MSVLFCDLVGFTASAHATDPEDVSRSLRAYHAQVRSEIQRYGGAVEKFIGDAIVGVWGAPVAREDDAERAVRSALSIVEAAEADVRVAVNTGEALVRLAPSADQGVGVIGDVVNTASRLQAVAPVGGVVVGEGTVRRTTKSIAYEELEPATLKGKPELVSVWRAVAARFPLGEPASVPQGPFVGRSRELRLVLDVFARTIEEPGLQLVSIVGEPGVGKSRLVSEVDQQLAARGSVTRLSGRCLAYGSTPGYGPFADIVMGYLGLTPASSAAEATGRLETALAGMPEAAWLRARLGPLIGLGGVGADREEAFSAWVSFLEELASRTPLVLIVEDLHWSDTAMLRFLRHLAEWSTGVPLLLICTARPEFLDLHPNWAGGLTNATTLALRPLSAADTRRLVHGLLPSVHRSELLLTTLSDRSGGNPLYAEEYARLVGQGSLQRLNENDVPDSLQAVIAARIDALAPDRKQLIHDAAVVGKVFWVNALGAVGGHDLDQVREGLHELARKDLVRRHRTSTLPDEEEYSFWHDLVQQVCYQQIPDQTVLTSTNVRQNGPKDLRRVASATRPRHSPTTTARR